MYETIPGVPAVETPLSWQCWIAREPVDLESLEAALCQPFGTRVGQAVAIALSHDLFEERACRLAERTNLSSGAIRSLVRQVRHDLSEDPAFREAVERAVHPFGVRRFVH